MFTTFLALLNSDGVNELGELKTVLENHLDVKIESIESERSIVDNVVLKTNRPLCIIIIDNNINNDRVRLCYLNNTKEINWEKTIYLVGIFGQYAIINNPITPKKLIKRFETIKTTSTENKHPVKHVVMPLSDIAELDQSDDFENPEAFMISFQSKPSTSRKIRFANNYPSEIKQDIPKSSTISKSSNGTRSKLSGILKTRKNNGRASVSAPTPKSMSMSPIASPPRTNKPTYMGWLFHKTPKKKTVRNLGPGPAMQRIIGDIQKGWKKEKNNP